MASSEDEEAGIFQQDAGDGDALALAAGDGDAALADARVVAVAELADELVGVGRGRCGDDLGVGGIGFAVADVFADGAGEEDAVLHDDADLGGAGTGRCSW